MAEDQVRKAVAGTFTAMRHAQKMRQLTTYEYLPSHEPASQDSKDDIIFLKTISGKNCRPSSFDTENDKNAANKTNCSAKRPIEATTLGVHKRARLSLPDPPASTELRISTQEERVESTEELKKRLAKTPTEREDQDTLAQWKEENQQLRKNNDQLVEEIEQLKMNHAMEIGFMEGGSGNLSDEVSNLKKDLERARQRIKELQRPASESAKLQQQLVEANKELAILRNCKENQRTTIERLQYKNGKLKRKIVVFQQKTASLGKLQRRIEVLEQQNVVLTCQLQAEDILRQLDTES